MQSGRWMRGMDDGGGQERSGFIDRVSNEYLHKKDEWSFRTQKAGQHESANKPAFCHLASREPPQTVAKTLKKNELLQLNPSQANWFKFGAHPNTESSDWKTNRELKMALSHVTILFVSERTFALTNG